MKLTRIKFLLAVALCVGLLTIIVGCNTTQQTIAYKTLYGVETATTGAYDGYVRLTFTGVLPTNSVPQVSKVYNTFQTSLGGAVRLARGNKNAIAPANVIADALAVTELISTIKGN